MIRPRSTPTTKNILGCFLHWVISPAFIASRIACGSSTDSMLIIFPFSRSIALFVRSMLSCRFLKESFYFSHLLSVDCPFRLSFSGCPLALFTSAKCSSNFLENSFSFFSRDRRRIPNLGDSIEQSNGVCVCVFMFLFWFV